MQEINVV